MKPLESAIRYVRDNKTWSDEQEDLALEIINELRCNLNFAAPPIAEEIHDLMEEWSDDNGYPSEWWLAETTEDEIFMQL